MARDKAQLLAMGARISKLREASGLGQQAIADYCDVRLRTYQFWQEGKHPPGGENLQKLAELFRSRGLDYVTERYILQGEAPDLAGSLTGDRSQLDAIDAKLDQIVERLNNIDAALVVLFSERVLVAGGRRDIEQARRQLAAGGS